MSVKRYEIIESSSVFEDVDGVLVDYSDYAALEASCAALAAENAGMKAAINEHSEGFTVCPCCGTEHDSCHDDVCRAVNEVPETDAFLAEVRAQGVEMLASLAGNECQRYKSISDRSGVRKWKSIVILCTDFAAQIRKGVI